MTKFWMVAITILALGLTTGCPDGDDDCASDPSLCDGGDTASDVGADGDADSDTTEDDADPDGGSDTACPTCSVAGDWDFYFEYYDSPSTVRLFQEGNHIENYSTYERTITGTITDGHIFLHWTWGSGGQWRDLTGEVVSYFRMEGTYVGWDPPGEVHSWYAERLTE